MEKLEFEFKLAEIGDMGEFEGWASTYDLDLGNDRVLQGAFKTTIRKTAGQVPVLLNHDRAKIIGVGVSAQEDHKGLYVKAKIAMNTQLGRETHELMAMGALKGLSIGFKLDEKGWVMDGKTRLLKSISLMEYSATPFPMNTEAQITRVKAVETMTAREFESTLRELGFSKDESLCIAAKGFNQYLKERRRESGPDSEHMTEEAESLLFDLKGHMSDLTAKSLLAQLSQSLT